MSQLQSSSLSLRHRSPVSVIAARWHKLIQRIRDPYRPELHYMRGPGPKWHAKHWNTVGATVL
jgi:hypothetical protein